MPLGGLRSSVEGTLHDDSAFPDSDNLRRARIANLADSDPAPIPPPVPPPPAPVPPVPMAAAAPPEVWTANPNLGNFNPGTAIGAKIFERKTKGLPEDKRLPLTRKSALAFRMIVESNAGTFGNPVTKIPVEYAADGTTVTKWANLTEDYSEITKERLIRESLKIYGTAVAETDAIPDGPFKLKALDPANNATDKETFFKRVHRNVLSEFLKNILDKHGLQQLIQKLTPYAFVDQDDGSLSFDGSLMLWLVVSKIDPSVIVGVETHRQKLENMKLHEYNNNVSDMCDDIERHYNRILSLNSDCESILRYTINALLTGSNDDFGNFIRRMKTDVESKTGPHKDDTYSDIIDAARAVYNNMEESGEWNKVNPTDAKLMALSTQLEKLKKENVALASLANEPANSNLSTNNNGSYKIEEWRFIKDGETMDRDGKKWWWCPHHNKGKGMYVRHPPSEHDDWAARKRAGQKYVPPDYRADFKSGGDNPPPTKPSDVVPEPKKMAISENLRSVLCNELMLSDEDADKLCTQVFKDT